MKPNRKQLLLKFFLATSLLAVLPLGIARWQENQRRNAPKTPYSFPFAELGALDKVVQERFAVVPTDDFGISRIGKRHESFVPQTSEEKAVVVALKKRGYEVIFYVAGHHYLKGEHSRLGPRFLQGPIFITQAVPLKKSRDPYRYFSPLGTESATLQKNLPDGGNLLTGPLYKPAFEALNAFNRADGTEFSMNGWAIIARPVRATHPSCVSCHNSNLLGRRFSWDKSLVQIGDTLGVAMYAYRRKKEKP